MTTASIEIVVTDDVTDAGFEAIGEGLAAIALASYRRVQIVLVAPPFGSYAERVRPWMRRLRTEAQPRIDVRVFETHMHGHWARTNAFFTYGKRADIVVPIRAEQRLVGDWYAALASAYAEDPARLFSFDTVFRPIFGFTSPYIDRYGGTVDKLFPCFHEGYARIQADLEAYATARSRGALAIITGVHTDIDDRLLTARAPLPLDVTIRNDRLEAQDGSIYQYRLDTHQLRARQPAPQVPDAPEGAG